MLAMAKQVTVIMEKMKSGYNINFPSDFVNNSAFPFESDVKLIAKIEGKKVVIEEMGGISAGIK